MVWRTKSKRALKCGRANEKHGIANAKNSVSVLLTRDIKSSIVFKSHLICPDICVILSKNENSLSKKARDGPDSDKLILLIKHSSLSAMLSSRWIESSSKYIFDLAFQINFNKKIKSLKTRFHLTRKKAIAKKQNFYVQENNKKITWCARSCDLSQLHCIYSST